MNNNSSKGSTSIERLLTPRQMECLKLAASGLTSSEVAVALNLSARTVDEYVADACHRLGVRNRTQAVAVMMMQASSEHSTSTSAGDFRVPKK